MRQHGESVSSTVTKRRFDMAVAAAADSSYAWPAVLTLISAAARSSVSTMCLLLGDRLDGDFLAAAENAFAQFAIPFAHLIHSSLF